MSNSLKKLNTSRCPVDVHYKVMVKCGGKYYLATKVYDDNGYHCFLFPVNGNSGQFLAFQERDRKFYLEENGRKSRCDITKKMFKYYSGIVFEKRPKYNLYIINETPKKSILLSCMQ